MPLDKEQARVNKRSLEANNLGFAQLEESKPAERQAVKREKERRDRIFSSLSTFVCFSTHC
jgi:hypothetical protein